MQTVAVRVSFVFPRAFLIATAAGFAGRVSHSRRVAFVLSWLKRPQPFVAFVISRAS
jgi:hypothetical protein